MAHRYDIGACITRVGWLYDAGYYLSVLKRHWLGGVNGEVLRAADTETCVRMEQAADMHTFMANTSPSPSPSPSPNPNPKQAADMHTFMSAAAPFAAPQDGAPNSGSIANAFAAYLAKSNPMGVAHNIQVPALIP